MSDSRNISTRLLPSLALAVVVATGAHVGHLPVWALALVPAAVGLRLALRRPVGKAVLTFLALATFAAILARFRGVSGDVEGGSLLSAMIGLKFLETRDQRDAGIVASLAYFQAASVFLASQAIAVAAYVFGSIAVTTCALTLIAEPAGPPIGTRLRAALLTLVQALPVMVVLFVLFPRIDSPLWAPGGGDSSSAVTGISDAMSPGTITQLTQSSAVAFRVQFEGAIPPPAQRYWRGPVFWAYDGRTWTPGRQRSSAQADVEGKGEPIRYTVTLEPHQQRWLFALDLPLPSKSGGAKSSAGATRLAAEDVTSVRGYEAASVVDYYFERQLSEARRRRALHLPASAAPRARELAREWRAQTEGPRAIVDRALTYFRANDFVYTLSPAALQGDPVDALLFQTREGFCEHYASAFAVLMRAARVPARVVVGYQGGETNAVGDYMVVRQSDAHAWTEVWLPEQGWVRVDPTEAVSAERIESGVSSVSGADKELATLSRRDEGLMRSAAMLWDSVNYGWNRFILGYGPELQQRVLARIGLAHWGRYALGALAVIVSALVVAVIWLLAQRPPKPSDPAVAAWQHALARLRRAGISVGIADGPTHINERVRQQRPDLAAQFDHIARLYIALRYRGLTHNPRLLDELQRSVRRFRVGRSQRQRARSTEGERGATGKWWPRRKQ